MQQRGPSAAGVRETLRKELVDTISKVTLGRREIPPDVAMEVAEHQGDEQLTDRELEVLKTVAAGNSNKIVADRLGITEETVKTHMRSVLSKLSANDRTHAVTIALKRGYSL